MPTNRRDRQQETMMSMIRTKAFLTATLGTVMLCAASSVWAQKYQYSYSAAPSSSRYVQRHAIPVGDLDGHEIVVYELQRIYATDQPTVMGVKVVESWAYGLTDQTNGVGTSEGYNVWILEDGNRLFSDFHGTVYGALSETGARKGTYYGTARFLGGTGKFAALRGTLTDEVQYYTDPKAGYNRPVTRGEYWFAK
jgi:hypothetical protein